MSPGVYTMRMYVRWQWRSDRKRKITRHYWKDIADQYASLVESVRVDGKPKQRHIAYLGSVHRDATVHERSWWWHRMNAKLDRLENRISPDDRKGVEAALARKMPPVTPDEVTAYDLQYQHRMRVDHELGECRGCYLHWPNEQAGVPPRPEFVKNPRGRFAKKLAAGARIKGR